MSTAVASTKRNASDISEKTSAKRSKKQEPVAIIMNDEEGNPLFDSESGTSSTATVDVSRNTEQNAAPTSNGKTTITPVQKINWRYLAKKGEDGKTNFERLVTVSNLNVKSDACFINFNKRQYEKETNERFSNKAAKNASTLLMEGPWMKVVYGLKDSPDYPGSFSMTLSTDNLDADDEVTDFVDFMEKVVDGHLKKEIITRGYDWMKDEDKYAKHLIVKQNCNTKDTVYKSSWSQGSYTQEQYEADVEDCIQGSLRPISKDGQGPLGMRLKAYPIKEGKTLVLNKDGLPQPDVMVILDSKPPRQISYFQTALGQRKGEGEHTEMYVKPVFSITRISFVKEKFHISPVCHMLCYKTGEDLLPEGGKQEMQFKFEGQATPATVTINRSNPSPEET